MGLRIAVVVDSFTALDPRGEAAAVVVVLAAAAATTVIWSLTPKKLGINTNGWLLYINIDIDVKLA